jgi:short-subunit dehydrogenase
MKARGLNVLLTGATGGIGSQTAALLATRGANLLLTARDEGRLNALKAELSAHGNRIRVLPADVATVEGRQRISAAAHEYCGGINVLVNNAGVNRYDLLEKQSGHDVEAIISTNLLAPMLLTQKLLPHLQRQPKAVVVNVGSIVGSIGLPGQVAYCSSKFGMHGFSEALRRELSGSTVRVVYVAPRSTDTDMNEPLLREINELSGVRTDDTSVVAKQIADAIARLPRERFIGWPERLFVKINAVLPGLVDRSMKKQARLLNGSRIVDEQHAISDGVK